MKKILFAISFTAMFTLLSVAASAQSKKETTAYPVPKWVSENGYWVIETNIHTPRINTIYFYNNSDVLVYKEKLDGIVLNVNKRKVKMNLKKALDQAVIAFNENQRGAENEMLVMNRIKKH